MLHVQNIGELGLCYDSARKSKAKRVWFQTRTFFLNIKAFLFLCCAHKLAIEGGRYINIPNCERFCNACDSGKIEN